jgi:hypothetical protein
VRRKVTDEGQGQGSGWMARRSRCAVSAAWTMHGCGCRGTHRRCPLRPVGVTWRWGQSKPHGHPPASSSMGQSKLYTVTAAGSRRWDLLPTGTRWWPSKIWCLASSQPLQEQVCSGGVQDVTDAHGVEMAILCWWECVWHSRTGAHLTAEGQDVGDPPAKLGAQVHAPRSVFIHQHRGHVGRSWKTRGRRIACISTPVPHAMQTKNPAEHTDWGIG